MTNTTPRAGFAILAATACLFLAACAGNGADPGGIMDVPAPAIGAEVIGQGTVIQKDDGPVEICLGPITMIYPPSCGGPEVAAWDWDSVDGATTEGGTTWGTYAVQGTWDGERLTVTEPPIMLALYDPITVEDPYTDPANAGTTPEAELARVVQELATRDGVLATYLDNGYVFVEVVHDDGALQEELDELYGADVTVVRSQLRPVD
ncbi:hypothetical protein FVA74_07230 [Salinibacterium sp. dk2585]|uniref:hypothetical protein n=1 Tax=unclassified Salinibacterium TaxID=2632331 RepID=UPI0011C24A9E|nr:MULTISPECIES: hypothetical protein [unclassified Salinibacterium]QEE61393.1 hypothetical protein FVA74_07230 [Salinibacterium sp. dk2585]TXK54070.1 hypothetical protein FVP63_08680 [Salinibacterium sp. dk5596]